MKYIVLFAALFTCGIANAQNYSGYGSGGFVAPPMYVPQGTTRILPNNSGGATLYNKQGYSGRVANYGTSQSLYDKNGRYQGRTSIGSNGQTRFTPVPTPRMHAPAYIHTPHGPTPHHR